MLIFPYSTALQLSRPPLVSYGIVGLCIAVFLLQINFSITESLLYYPASWNPVKMITSALAHAGWWHLVGNMVFFMAFAPALEILLDNRIRYLWIMLVISLVVGIAYSISTLLGSTSLPTLGFSGVVTGMIGLSAYLMPKARIKVFWWYIVMWKTFYVQAWVLAAIYIGMDIWTMFSADNYGGINLVAHVAGGFCGYLYGYLRLADRKAEVQEELDEEIQAMTIRQRHGNTRAEAYRYQKHMDQRQAAQQEAGRHDKLMRRVYQMVKTHRDAEALLLLFEHYGLATPVHELEPVFQRMQDWGGSRCLLCIGRLIIYKLDLEKREGRVIVYIEQCQRINPQFLLPDVSRVLYYAQLAYDSGRPEVASNLVMSPDKRYGGLVNHQQCHHLYELCKR